jgi:drug/metabolite transporter (DMT)-like permease
MSPESARSRAALLGPALILLYCLINAVKAVWEGWLVQNISPEVIAFHCFLIAQLCYMAINAGSLNRIMAMAMAHKGDFLAVNVSTAAAWLGILYALTIFEPVVANGVSVALVPLCTLLLSRHLRRNSIALSSEIVCCVGIFLAGVGYFIYAAIAGASSLGQLPLGESATGFGACMVVAVGVSGANLFSRRLNDHGMTASQLMASRFTLLIVLAGGLMLWRGSAAPYTASNLMTFTVIGIAGVAVAVYVLQVGISRTEPVTVSLLLPVNLVMTYGLQFFDPRLTPAWTSLFGVLSLSILIILGTWFRIHASRRAAF